MPSCSSEIPILSTNTGAGSSGMDAGIGDREEDIISTTIICNRRELRNGISSNALKVPSSRWVCGYCVVVE